MNHKFLVTPPRLNQALETTSSGGGSVSNDITRRTFLKRTGGATVATLVAWNLTSNRLRATEPEPVSASEWRMTCVQPISDNRVLLFRRRVDKRQLYNLVVTAVIEDGPDSQNKDLQTYNTGTNGARVVLYLSHTLTSDHPKYGSGPWLYGTGFKKTNDENPNKGACPDLATTRECYSLQVDTGDGMLLKDNSEPVMHLGKPAAPNDKTSWAELISVERTQTGGEAQTREFAVAAWVQFRLKGSIILNEGSPPEDPNKYAETMTFDEIVDIGTLTQMKVINKWKGHLKGVIPAS